MTVSGRGENEESGEPSGRRRPARPARRRDAAPTTPAPPVDRDARLAELVSGLTGSPKGTALHAVVHDDGPDTTDALEVVARAMVKVDQPPPKELRLDRFVRQDVDPGE